MTNTGYARTSAFPQRYRANLPERHAAGDDWETLEIFEVTPPTGEPWHAGVYCTADVDSGTVGQLRLRSSGATAVGTSTAGTGTWSVAAGGKIVPPAGGEFFATGLNGGAHIGTGVSFGVAADVSIGWAYDGYPGVSFKRYSDVWTTAPQLVNGAEIFPGGTISPGKYWNHAAIDDTSNPLGGTTVVTLPDRVYAMTGVRSSDAIAFGIPQPTDYWHAGIYRMNCHLVNGPNTWGSAPTLAATDTVPQYVARAQELVNRGLVVSIECHDMTGLDIQVPAGLVSNPSLAVGSIPAGPHQDACRLYDAVAAAFPGNTHNVWVGLPNEAWTTGRNTNLTNNATLTQRYDDFVVTYVRRIRAAGFTGIISIPLGRWAGELGPLSRGDYDSLITTLAGHGVAYNLVWEWHQYGADYPVGVGAAAVTYTYAAADEQLAACRAKGIAVWMAEYGRPTPTPLPTDTIEYRTVAAVDIMATDTYGTPLALKYPWICPTWWSTADNTFDVSYALTYGAANKGNDAGPDPNSTGPNAGVFPWWKITSPAAADEWLTYGGRAHWDLGHAIVAAGEAATMAGVSPPVTVAEFSRNIRLGFEGIPAGAQLLYVEGRRSSGTGGVRLIQARPTILSAPPAELITGDPPTSSGGGGGGGGGVTASDVRATFVSDDQATSFTILPSWFSPPAQPGDKVALMGFAPGPSENATHSWTFPGTPKIDVAGGAFHPRAKVTEVDYSATGWTVTASNAFRAAAICFRDTVSIVAGTPVQATAPANPTGVAHDGNAMAVVVNCVNFTTAEISGATTTPGTHQVIIDKKGVPRSVHAAKIAQLPAGTYDPGAGTISGTGAEQSTAFALVAQPTASATFPSAPTVPAFTGGTLTTLSTLSANIASIVAAANPGDRFKLVAGTYTNWSDVRPKTGMHFQSPDSGVAILEGTGKTWAFRAIDATGSSDNVTISCTGTGSIKIQNYGAGTNRAEYGAIQAQPTDTSVGSAEYTYGHAQGWYIHGVTLEKNGAQGILCSDYFTLHNVTAYGHNVSGVGGDRGVGGLMYGCTINANGLNPATGAYSNGAGAKFTFWNGGDGRLAVVPLASQRPKAPIRVVNSNFAATQAGVTGTGNIGLWFDLDCQLIEIYGGNFNNHTWCGIMTEGCNNVYMTGIAIDNSDGYSTGAGGAGEDFLLGALTIAESTNVTVENYGILNSVRAVMIRQSNRSADWYNSNNASFVNFAWPTGPRYWIKATGPLPVPGPSDTSNMWSGNITLRNGLFTSCDRVLLQEGSNGGGMSAAGSLPLNTIRFEGNNYTSSPSILFYDRSNTGLSLAAWQALPYVRDN